MSEKSHYPGLSITVPVDGLIKITKAAEAALANKQPEILELMGDYLLEKIRDDYQTKARGGTGEDGVTWPGLLPDSLRKRKRSRGIGSGAAARGVASKGSGSSTRDISKARSPTGRRSAARRSRGKTRTSKDTGRKRISPAAGNYEIGIDTGAQLNSLKSKKGGDAGASVVIVDGSVTVQAAMSYSKYFSKTRPIVPEQMPEKWVKGLEEKLEMLGAKALTSEIEKCD